MQAAKAEYVAESEIVKQHHRRIMHLASQYANSRIDYKDLVQEGKIALLDCARNYRSDRGAQLWTYAIKFVRAAMMRYSTAATRDIPSEVEDIDESQPSYEPSAESILEQKECISVLAQQFSYLRENERSVLRMRFVDDMDVRDIAEKLSIPKSTVSDLIQAALEKLRERVGARL
jgi:RNA polymerase sigma factor (sigma-70 family)